MARQPESVWDYPRPPRLDPTDREVVVRYGDTEIARTRRAVRVLETTHPPSFYIPPEDVRANLLEPLRKRTVCEFKGTASYFALRVAGALVAEVAWTYPSPTREFESIASYIAFYPSKVECYVDGERVRPEAGSFYGGWITDEIADARPA